MRDEARLVFDDAAVGVALEAEDPLATNGLPVWGAGRELVRTEALELRDFAIHRGLPVRPVGSCLGFREALGIVVSVRGDERIFGIFNRLWGQIMEVEAISEERYDVYEGFQVVRQFCGLAGIS